METTEKLRDYILTKYKSLRQFTIEIDMPYSTFDTIMHRGIMCASIQNVFKICNALNISVDALANGRIIDKDLYLKEWHEKLEKQKEEQVTKQFQSSFFSNEELDEMEKYFDYLASKRDGSK